MTLPFSLISTPQQSLWLLFFVDVSLKGITVLAVSAVVVAALRHGSASMRHHVWCAAIVGLLALPLLEAVLPGWRIPIVRSLTTARSGVARGATPAVWSQANPEPVETGTSFVTRAREYPSTGRAAAPSPVPDRIDGFESGTVAVDDLQGKAVVAPKPMIEWTGLALVVVWIAGGCIVLIRLALALCRVGGIAGRAERVTDLEWTRLAKAVSERLGLTREPELLRTAEVTLPVTWGIRRPLVLLPSQADRWSDERREVVLLHEFSHVRRCDCMTQTLALVACALHWFNPLAWIAARQLRKEREIACDNQVLETGTRSTDYAGHLVDIAGALELAGTALPMTAGMACSQLEDRVRSILDPEIRRSGPGRFKVLLTWIAAISMVITVSVVRPWTSAASSRSSSATLSSSAAAAVNDGYELIQPETVFRADVGNTATLDAGMTRGATIDGVIEQERGAGRAGNETADADVRQEGTGGGAGVGSGAGYGAGEGVGQGSGKGEGRSSDLTVEQIIRLKTYGITPEFIESVRKMGFENASVDQMIQLRVHGIDENFIREARSWGYNEPSIDQLVRLKVSDMSGEYIAAMKQAGYGDLPLGKLAMMKMQGVTPEYVAAMRKAGFDKLTGEELLALRVQGIDEEFIRQAQGWGFGNLSAGDLIRIRVHNLTPAFAAEMRAVGIDNLSLEQLLRMRVHGVSADFVRQMGELGFNGLTSDQLIRMKIHGVDVDYVRKMRAAGFKNVSLDKLIELRVSGVDEILLKGSR
jgi:beta-lactamase regulating signal transducer with metallopeptidase domain